jgi:hypothetical protein
MPVNKRYLILAASLALSAIGIIAVLGLAPAPVRALDGPTPPCPSPEKSLDGRVLPGSLRAACAGEGDQEFWAAPAAPIPSGSQDGFGYTLDDTKVYTWIDATTGTAVILDSRYNANVVSGPISLGFPFKFYENQYSEVYISDNGLLGFDASIQPSGVSYNQTIPNDNEYPQNVIAPFWDYLVVDPGEGSAVYYDTGVQNGKDYFVVEWHQVDSRVESGNLTFEAILYEDGDIVFLYDELAGPIDSATVGIEDSYGMDGLQYLFNSEGLQVGKDILFDRPAPSRRVSVSPGYQGAFVIDGESSFQVYVRNTGDVGSADTFTLNTDLSNPAWSATLRDQVGQPVITTGALDEGDIFTLTVVLSAPPVAEVGDQVTVTLMATSTNALSKSASSQLISAVPAPFGLTYREGQPLKTEFISRYAVYEAVVEKYYFAQAFALSNVREGDYISVWEGNNRIRYLLLNGIGTPYTEDPRDLTSGIDIDLSPVATTAPTGTIGVAWMRSKTIISGTETLYNDNVYFTRLDQTGEQIGEELNVTGILTETDTPITFDNIRIAATEDNRFHLSWVQIDPSGATDIGYAVYDAVNDVPEKAAEMFTDGVTSDDVDYMSPALVEYGSQVLLLYFSRDTTEPLTPTEKIVYGKFETDGDLVLSQTDLFTDAKGTGIDGIQLSDGNLALAWTVTDEGKIAVALIDDLGAPDAPILFSNPDGRGASTVSVTDSQAGQAILTWIDADFRKRLYYALVDRDHGVVTSPVAFKYMPSGLSSFQTSLGWGNASYVPMFRVTLPMVYK